MHDLRLIRDDPQSFDAGLARRGVEPVGTRILQLDEQRRAAATSAQEALARRNEASRAIGQAMGKGDTATAEALKAEVATLKTDLPALEQAERPVRIARIQLIELWQDHALQAADALALLDYADDLSASA